MWAKTALPGYILTTLGDRMEMADSVEGRVPFLDHHVVEVICSTPEPEGAWHDGEIRSPGGGPRCNHRYGVSTAEASVSEPAGNFESGPAAQYFRPGHITRPGSCLHSVFRSRQSRGSARQLASHG